MSDALLADTVNTIWQ